MRQLQEHLAAVRIQRVTRRRHEVSTDGDAVPVPAPEPVLEPEPEPASVPDATTVHVPSIADSPMHISGLWQGSRRTTSLDGPVDGATEEESIAWVLSLQRKGADINTPTCFGATVINGDSPFTLRGAWAQSTGKVKLMAVPENFPEDDDLHYEYEATLVVPEAGNSWRLEGHWRSVTGAEVAAAEEAKSRGDSNALSTDAPKVWDGTFSCELAAGDSKMAQGMGGLFLGEAVPVESLADSVPRNPINWALAALPAPARDSTESTTGALPLVGAGYFDDSGDFTDSPVLFYYLHGKLDANTGRFTLNKIYERKTGGLKITYTGEVVVAGDTGQGGQLAELKGEWANIDQQTFGVFGCRQEAQ